MDDLRDHLFGGLRTYDVFSDVTMHPHLPPHSHPFTIFGHSISFFRYAIIVPYIECPDMGEISSYQ